MRATTTETIREEDLAELDPVLDALVPQIRARYSGLVPRIEEEAEEAERKTLAFPQHQDPNWFAGGGHA